jgi:hypothetical protein
MFISNLLLRERTRYRYCYESVYHLKWVYSYQSGDGNKEHCNANSLDQFIDIAGLTYHEVSLELKTNVLADLGIYIVTLVILSY